MRACPSKRAKSRSGNPEQLWDKDEAAKPEHAIPQTAAIGERTKMMKDALEKQPKFATSSKDRTRAIAL